MQADLRLCWSHIPHLSKSHALALNDVWLLSTHYMLLHLENRPIVVKRALVGSKGGWKLSTIFKLYSDSSIINIRERDAYIFAAPFGTTSHCFC